MTRTTNINNTSKNSDSSRASKENSVGLFKFLFGMKIGFGNLFLFIGIFMMLIHSALTVLNEVLFGIGLNFIKNNNMENLKTFCLITTFIGPASCIVSIISGYFYKKHSDILCEKYKKSYYSLVFKQDFNWFNKQDLNKLSELIKSDNEKIQKGTGRKLFYLMKFLACLIFYFMYFFILSWKVSLSIVPLVIGQYFLSIYYQKEMDRLAENNKKLSYHQSGYIRELLIKYKTLLSFGNFNYEKEYYKNLIKQNLERNNDSSFWKNLIINSMSFLNFTINGIVILFGSYIIKETLYDNLDTSGINNIFTFQNGQILSFILSVFFFEFLLRDIFYFLKDLSETFLGAQTYYQLEEQDKNKASKLTNKNLIQISNNEKKNNFDIKIMNVNEINFVDVGFDYKFLSNKNKRNNKAIGPEEDNIDLEENLKINNGDINMNIKPKNIINNEEKKEEEKNENPNGIKTFTQNLDVQTVKLLLSPSRKAKRVALNAKQHENEPSNQNKLNKNQNKQNITFKSPLRKHKNQENLKSKFTNKTNKSELADKHRIDLFKEDYTKIDKQADQERLTILPSKNKNLQENNSSNISDSSDEIDFIVSFEENFNNHKANQNFSLENINITFEKKYINYLIGKSGSGKTSMLSLVLKLFRPTAGKIMLNKSFDIHKLSEDEYCNLISYVPQESIFYDLSVKENIRFFQEISDEKILEVIKLLNMDKFVSKLKYGVDTKIGPNGSEISGGQRQLISIARALVKNPKILLLDEFTSNFDNILTKNIFEILNNLCENIIVIVVTHNVKIIDFNNDKNKIFFMDQGKIKEKNLKILRKNLQENLSFDSNNLLNSSNSNLSNISLSRNQSECLNDSFKLDDPDEGKSSNFSKDSNNSKYNNHKSSQRIKIIKEEGKEIPSLTDRDEETKQEMLYMNSEKVPINDTINKDRDQDKGIKSSDDCKNKFTYVTSSHQKEVIEDINDNIDYSKRLNSEQGIYSNINNNENDKNIMNSNDGTSNNLKVLNQKETASEVNLQKHFFVEFLKKNKGSLIFITLSYVISSFIIISYGVIFYFLSDKLYSRNADDVLLYGKIFFAIYVSLGIINTLNKTFQKISIDRISSSLVYSMNKKVFNWFLNLNIPALKDNNKNEIIKIFSDHITTIGPIFKSYLGLIIEILFTCLSAIIMSIAFDWRVGLICIGLIMIFIAYSKLLMWANSRLVVDIESFDYLSETISNIKLIKAFNLKENLLEFIIEQERQICTKASIFNHISHYYVEGGFYVLIFCVVAFINYIGGLFILELNLSTLISFTGSSSLLSITAMLQLMIIKYIGDFNFVNMSMTKLGEILGGKYKDLSTTNYKTQEQGKQALLKSNYDTNNNNNNNDGIQSKYEKAAYETNCNNENMNSNNPIGLQSSKNIRGKIEFRNVSFSYSAEKNKSKVLNNVSFIIRPGTKVGFVGTSGSGKSTIFQLLLRFFEPNEGEILLDGKSIKDFDPRELRDFFSGVFQEPDLFERSIYDNLKYGNLNSTKEEIAAAALIAQVPLKLLDENSTQTINQISGGQKQRIAIARCLLKKRKIFFFDEATSALDVNTEKKIIFNLDRYFSSLEEKTTQLIIAHRLINLQNCDLIFVLKDGQLIESGNHKDLVNKKGLYKELWEKEKSQ